MMKDYYNFRGQSIDCTEVSFFTTTNAWIIIGLVLGLVVLCMIVFPIYGVWSSRKHGQAELAEAQGRFSAAELNKKAAIVEAEAVAAQITTIGEHLKQHDLYLRWQWIEMMKHRQGETIYVPTEANLPVLEATRRQVED